MTINHVSSFATNNTLQSEMNRNLTRLFEREQQVATGKKFQDFRGYGPNAGAIMAARAQLSQFEQYGDVQNETKLRLDVQNQSLERLHDLTKQLKQTVLTAGAQQSGTAFMEQIRSLTTDMISALNTQIDGRYIFAGTNTNVAPVNVDSLEALQDSISVQGNTIDDVFTNTSIKPSIEIEEGLSLDYSFLADGLAKDLFTAILQIESYNDGTHPGSVGPGTAFDVNLDGAQQSFLLDLVPTIETQLDSINDAVAANGIRQNILDEAMLRTEENLIFTNDFVSEIEDVDMAEAITKLKQDETAVQASFQVITTMNRLSILNFL